MFHILKKFKGDKSAQFHEILTECPYPFLLLYEDSFDLTVTISSAIATDGTRNRSYSFAADTEMVMQPEFRGCDYTLFA